MNDFITMQTIDLKECRRTVLHKDKRTESVLSLGTSEISTFRDDRILGRYNKKMGMSQILEVVNCPGVYETTLNATSITPKYSGMDSCGLTD